MIHPLQLRPGKVLWVNRGRFLVNNDFSSLSLVDSIGVLAEEDNFDGEIVSIGTD